MTAAEYQTYIGAEKLIAVSSEFPDSERRQMLGACGVESLEDLFSHLPPEVRLNRPLNLAPGISEYEIVEYFRARGRENANGYASFLGAGVYNHYRPVLVDTVVSRGEFLTSYTPYQAEISQGTLTTIFEFQTMICQLTGMDVANASMYDGSTAVPEAAMMAVRITGRRRRAGLAQNAASRVSRGAADLCPRTRACRSTSSPTIATTGKAGPGGSREEAGRRDGGRDRPIAEFLRHRGGT